METTGAAAGFALPPSFAWEDGDNEITEYRY